MTEPTTHTVDVPGAVLTYDVREPDTPSDQRPLFIFGSPMGASGFEQLVSQFGDRTVITYDPRGMDRSTREPDSELTAEVHADDYHRVVEAAGLGPVDAFASSGGGMCALHWIVAHPEDVRTLVCHEPPLVTLLEDREMAIKVNADIVDTYHRDGYGPAMAKFIHACDATEPAAGRLPGPARTRPGAVRAANPGRRVARGPASGRQPRDAAVRARRGCLALPHRYGSSRRSAPSEPADWLDVAARRSPSCSVSSRSSSQATTGASPPTNGPRTTTRPPSPRRCAGCWSERRCGLPLRRIAGISTARSTRSPRRRSSLEGVGCRRRGRRRRVCCGDRVRRGQRAIAAGPVQAPRWRVGGGDPGRGCGSSSAFSTRGAPWCGLVGGSGRRRCCALVLPDTDRWSVGVFGTADGRALSRARCASRRRARCSTSAWESRGCLCRARPAPRRAGWPRPRPCAARSSSRCRRPPPPELIDPCRRSSSRVAVTIGSAARSQGDVGGFCGEDDCRSLTAAWASSPARTQTRSVSAASPDRRGSPCRPAAAVAGRALHGARAPTQPVARVARAC